MRLQFVWWPWRFGWPFIRRWKGSLRAAGLIYSICFFPVEIRVWKRREPQSR